MCYGNTKPTHPSLDVCQFTMAGCVFLDEGVTPGTAIAFPNSTIAGHVINAFYVVDEVGTSLPYS